MEQAQVLFPGSLYLQIKVLLEVALQRKEIKNNG